MPLRRFVRRPIPPPVRLGLLMPALLAALLLPIRFAGPALAQPAGAVQHLDEGNQRYAAGDYRGALAAYEAAVATGYASGALYYNMGNAYYRLDELGQAIVQYERARRLLPDDPMIRHNLEMARARTNDRFSLLPEPFWRPAWRRIVHLAGADGLLALGLLAFAATCLLVGLRLWNGPRPPWHRRSLAVAATASVLLIGAGFAASLEAANRHQAVVVADDAALHEAPTPDADTALTLHEGVLVDVLQTRGAWLRVRLPNGTTGWIRAAATADV